MSKPYELEIKNRAIFICKLISGRDITSRPVKNDLGRSIFSNLRSSRDSISANWL